MTKAKRIEIELPFAGFYESWHDQRINDAIESYFNYDYAKDEDREPTEIEADAIFMADVDWRAIQVEYCEHWVDALADELELDLKYSDMTSPAYYNFSTDRLFATIPAAQANRIRKEVEAYPEWPEYIKDNYTSYDGFSSNYSNDSTDEEWTRPELDQCQWMVIIKLWLKHQYEDWTETEISLYEYFEVSELGTINTAYEVINKYIETKAKERLEELRVELQAERISTGELLELAELAKYIEPGDVELLEAAGVPEGMTGPEFAAGKRNEDETEELGL